MRNKKGLTGSMLKIIAMISMLIDHTAYTVLGTILVRNGINSVKNCSPEYMISMIESGSIGWVYLGYQIMRKVLGRLAFPVFCFLLVEGFEKTRSRSRYALRMLLFALISEIPFDLLFSLKPIDWKSQNVIFTLLLGFLTMWGMEWIEVKSRDLETQWGLQILLVMATGFLAEKISCDYGASGILAIGLFFIFRKNRSLQLLLGCGSFFWEWPACFSCIPLSFYNGERGMKLKYVFYAFYPVHLLLLYLLRQYGF